MALRGGGGSPAEGGGSGREVKRLKFCLSVRGAGCCEVVPREVVHFPALEIAKTCLWMILRGPHQPGVDCVPPNQAPPHGCPLPQSHSTTPHGALIPWQGLGSSTHRPPAHTPGREGAESRHRGEPQ